METGQADEGLRQRSRCHPQLAESVALLYSVRRTVCVIAYTMLASRPEVPEVKSTRSARAGFSSRAGQPLLEYGLISAHVESALAVTLVGYRRHPTHHHLGQPYSHFRRPQ